LLGDTDFISAEAFAETNRLHYHRERNHQGLENRLIEGDTPSRRAGLWLTLASQR
jgi:hypothetical protein